jgi:hypothetical protein
MSANFLLILFAAAGLWLLFTNAVFIRKTYKLKQFMEQREYSRLQRRHVALSALGLLLFLAAVTLYQ